MTTKTRRGARLIALAAMGSAFILFAGAAQAASLTIVDQTVAGPIGGARLCVDTTCQDAQGIANLHVKLVLNTSSLIPPAVTASGQPGCTANINVQLNVTTLGLTGTLDTTIEWDRTDRNGNVVSHTTLPIPSIPISTTAQTHSVSFCVTVL